MKNLLVAWAIALSSAAWAQNIDSILFNKWYEKLWVDLYDKWNRADWNEDWPVIYEMKEWDLLVEYIESEIWKELILLLTEWDKTIRLYSFNDYNKVETEYQWIKEIHNEKINEAERLFSNMLSDILWIKRL